MTCTINDVLSDEAIERTSECTSNKGKVYSLWLKGISTEIQITLSQDSARGGYKFHLSHFIHTPGQAAPYCPSSPWSNNDVYALRLAVTAITQYYNQAVGEGRSPSSNWLVENK